MCFPVAIVALTLLHRIPSLSLLKSLITAVEVQENFVVCFER